MHRLEIFDHFEKLKLKCKQFANQVQTDVAFACNRQFVNKSPLIAFAFKMSIIDDEVLTCVNIHRQVHCSNLSGSLNNNKLFMQVLYENLQTFEEDVNLMLQKLSFLQKEKQEQWWPLLSKIHAKFYWKMFDGCTNNIDFFDLIFAIKNVDGQRFVDCDGSICRSLAKYYNPNWTCDVFWYWWSKLGLYGYRGLEFINFDNFILTNDDFFDNK